MISAAGIACRIGLNLRSRFVHGHGTAVEHRSVQGRNGAQRFGRLRHLHERDAPRFARIPVFDDRDALDGSVNCKQLPQLLLRHRDIQVPHKNVSHKVHSLLDLPKISQSERNLRRRS